MKNGYSVEYRFQKGNEYIYDELQFHPYLEIYYFIDGDVEYVNSNMRIKMEKGQIAVISPGEYHYMHVLSGVDGYTRCVVNIWPDFVDSDTFCKVSSRGGIISAKSSRIKDDLDYLTEMRKKLTDSEFQKILECAAQDMMYSLKYCESTSVYDMKAADALEKKIIKYIDDNLSGDVSLMTVANAMNYSVSHISHTFKEAYGISIRDYISGKRLNLARVLILSGERTQEACMKAGFSDYSSFFRMYKKAFGKSPSKFRRNE